MIDFLKNFLDPYERKSRLTPMLIALVPVFVLLLVYTPIRLELSVKSGIAVLAYGAACSAFSIFSRRAGKRVEDELKVEWGGWPTMTILRHRDQTIDPTTKARIHLELSRMVPGTKGPTSIEELDNPTAADIVYLAWSEHLRKLARNESKTFHHVFNENCAYGFSRNLYGLRIFALTISLLAAAVSVGAGVLHWNSTHVFPTKDVVCGASFLGFSILWRLVVTRSLVKQAAYDYAKRVFDDCVLVRPTPKPKKEKKVKT